MTTAPGIVRTSMQDVVIGVDIGGTNSVVGLVDYDGTLLVQSRFPTHAHESAESFVPRLSRVIEELSKELPPRKRITGIAIASPAADAQNGIVDNPANFNWGRVDLLRMMQAAFDLPIAVMNDSDAAVVGESHFGAARGMKNIVLLTLGTGLGAGILIDGKLVQGANGFAGEFGHMTAVPNGRVCACGRRGCVETYISATGVRRTVFELLSRRLTPSPLRAIAYNDLTTDRVFEFARAGDAIALAAFRATGETLGLLLANVAAGFDPEAIILSGGLVNAGDFLMEPARQVFERSVLERYKGKTKILVSTLNDGQAAILGASSFVREMPFGVEET